MPVNFERQETWRAAGRGLEGETRWWLQSIDAHARTFSVAARSVTTLTMAKNRRIQCCM